MFDAGEADGYRFLTMEFAAGGSLRQRLQSAPADRPTEERIVDAHAVVDGLAAIHAAGIIHRDVKPDNVLRMEDGRLVLTDFGLAVAPGQTTFYSGYSGAVGTPSYMAPEVALGGDASMAADVFSLGVILHEIFFNRRPEWNVTKRGRFLKSPVTKRSSRVEKSMARLCSECLEELSPRRLQNAKEVQERFSRAVVGRYRSIVGAMRAARWGLGVGAVLAVLATVVTSVLMRPNETLQRARIVGEPGEWKDRARSLVAREGTLQCLDALPDGNRVRAIWRRPDVALDIDVFTGQSTPSRLAPETYRGGACPQLSLDGRSLVFSSEGHKRMVMLSREPDGRNAEPLVPGYAPIWMPSGNEIVYAADSHRVAVLAPPGSPTFLSEAFTGNRMIYDIGVSPTGNEVAVLYGGENNDSFLAKYEFPSLALKSRSVVPMKGLALRYRPSPGSLYLLAGDNSKRLLAELSADGSVRPRGRLDALSAVFLSVAGADLVSTMRSTDLLYVRDANGREQLLASSPRFGQAAESQSGDLLVSELLNGREVIALSRRGSRALEPITLGPLDSEPAFTPDGSEFAYFDGAHGNIVLCSLRSPLACRNWAHEADGFSLPAFSPGGQSLAYVARLGGPSGIGSFSEARLLAWISALRKAAVRAGPQMAGCGPFCRGKDRAAGLSTTPASDGPPPTARPWRRLLRTAVPPTALSAMHAASAGGSRPS